MTSASGESSVEIPAGSVALAGDLTTP